MAEPPTLEETLEALHYLRDQGILSEAFAHLVQLLQETRDRAT